MHITERYMNSECVLESRDTPTAGNNLIPNRLYPSLSIVHVYRLCTFSYMCSSEFTCFGQSRFS